MTAISRNVYFDVLDDIVNKYNNTVHRTIKIKPIGLKGKTFVDSMELHSKKEVNDKDPTFKVRDHVSTKISLQKDTHQIGLRIIKLIIQFHGHMLIMILMVKKLQEHFMKKNCRRLIKKIWIDKKDLVWF